MEANPECGAISVLECWHCPGVWFSNWEDFKRHCDMTAGHLLKFSCDYCGSFFAMHCENPLNTCILVIEEEAKFNRRETNGVHEFKFKLWQKHCLKTIDDLGSRFGFQLVSRLRAAFKFSRLSSYPTQLLMKS